MRYAYYDTSDQQFEALVIELAAWLLGSAVQGFSTGPDEGRDARFAGTAERFPSKTAPIAGRFVLQAKHTEHPYAKFSDPDFSGPGKTSTLTRELPRIKKLVEMDELDHYMLFSNRRLGGQAERQIRKRIIDETGVQTAELFGVERIDSTLGRCPDALERAGLSELKSPLLVTPDDLAEIICALDKHKDTFRDASGTSDIHRVTFAAKNRANRVSEGFAKEIKKEYLRHFDVVKDFLAHPANEEYQERYLDAVAEFREQIIAHGATDHPLDQVLLNIQRLLWQRDNDLNRRKRLTKLVLYYMYWVCDLGEA